jgi:hypothetical protein
MEGDVADHVVYRNEERRDDPLGGTETEVGQLLFQRDGAVAAGARHFRRDPGRSDEGRVLGQERAHLQLLQDRL